MLEKTIETYLVKKIRDLGGIAYKFVSPARRSVPDRIVLLNGRAVFVEVKAPGKKATRLQLKEHEKIREQGFLVLVIDSKVGVDDAFPG